MTSVQPLRTRCSRSISAGLVVLAIGACDNDSTESTRVFERGCDECVEGELAADWETEAVSVGPLLFAYLRTLYLDPASLRQIPTPAGRYPPLKVLAVVRAGHVARVVIPDDATDQVALLYDVAAWPNDNREGLRLADGETEVEFRACSDRDTQFNGGFLVAAPGYIVLDVYVDDGTEPAALRAPFGAPCQT